MLISTDDDLIQATLAVAEGSIQIDELQFAEYITSKIKIYSDNFQSASELDFRIAKIMLAVQKDFLHIYNLLLDKNITLEQLDKHEFLIVKFNIENGCLEAIWKILGKYYKDFIDSHENLKLFLAFFNDMTATQKIITLLIILAAVGTWKAPEIISAYRSNPEINDIIENNIELTDILAKNQQTTSVIINNLGNGYVEFDGKKYTKENYEEAKIKKPSNAEIAPVEVIDTFFIQKYDFDKQRILVFVIEHDSFWASTAWLPEVARIQLKEAMARAIDAQTVGKEIMLVSCKFKNGRIIEAQVNALNVKADSRFKTFAQAIGSPPLVKMRPSHAQGNLFD